MTHNYPKHIKYWLSEARHDCFFMVGPEDGSIERIGALKHHIMGFSEPFRALLQDSELAEPGDIRLIDVEPETFRNFLICVYGGSEIVIPKLSFDELAKLLYIVEKYLVEHVKEVILKQLYITWSPENIFIALSQPVCLSEENLRTRMADTLKKGFLDISRHEEFLNVSDTAIRWILQQEHLNVNELEIWMAILRWAKHQVKSNCGETLRSRILPFLKYIRLLAMDYKDFDKHVVVSGVLLKDEIDETMRSFITGNIPSNEYLCKRKNHRYDIRKESENIVSSSLEISNGVLIWSTINNISTLDSWEFSEGVCFAGFAWQIMVGKSVRNNVNYLSVFLRNNNCITGWPYPIKQTCSAHVTLTLLNQTGIPDCTRLSTHEFIVEEDDWGYMCFLEWDRVLNPEEGFLEDNKIFVSTRIQLNK